MSESLNGQLLRLGTAVKLSHSACDVSFDDGGAHTGFL